DQPAHRERGVRAHLQLPALAAPLQPPRCVAQAVDGARDGTVVLGALARERDLAMAALEQLQAEGLFEGLDLATDCTRGDVQLVGGQRDAHVACSRFERTYRIEWRKSVGAVHWEMGSESVSSISGFTLATDSEHEDCV